MTEAMSVAVCHLGTKWCVTWVQSGVSLGYKEQEYNHGRDLTQHRQLPLNHPPVKVYICLFSAFPSFSHNLIMFKTKLIRFKVNFLFGLGCVR